MPMLRGKHLEMIMNIRYDFTDGVSEEWKDALGHWLASAFLRCIEDQGETENIDTAGLRTLFIDFLRIRYDTAKESLEDPDQLRIGDDEESWKRTMQVCEQLLRTFNAGVSKERPLRLNHAAATPK